MAATTDTTTCNAAVEWRMEGHSTVSSFLVSSPAQKVVDFVTEVFNAHTMYNIPNDDGTVMHASLKIGDTVVMVTEGNIKPEQPAFPSWVHVYVPDVDKTYAAALSKGAQSVVAPKDESWGDRMAAVKDVAGNTWWIATHKFKPAGCTGTSAEPTH